MHKGTNTIYYKKGKQKGFLLSCTKKLVTAVSSPLGCQNTICQLHILLLACLVVLEKKYEKNFLFLFFTIPFPSGGKAGLKKSS